MGWTYQRQAISKKDFINGIRENYRSSGYQILRSRLVGKCLWTVVVTPNEGNTPTIYVDLIDKSEGCYGQKTMSIDEHPYYYNCPLEYLEFICPQSYNARSWVENVLRHHQEKNRPIAVGATYNLQNVSSKWMKKNGDCVRVISLRPFRGITSETKVRVRLNKNILGEMIPGKTI